MTKKRGTSDAAEEKAAEKQVQKQPSERKRASARKKQPSKAAKKRTSSRKPAAPEVKPVEAAEKDAKTVDKIQEDLPEYVSKACIAALFGLTSRRIEQLVGDGVIYSEKIDNRVAFRLEDTVREYIRHFADKSSGREQKETIDELTEKKLRAEIRLKESQGELHELRTAISLGEYIAKEEIQADYTIFFVRFRNFALSLATRISGMISGHVDPTESRRIEGDIQKEIESLLSSFTSRSITPEMAEAKKTVKKPSKTEAAKGGIGKPGRPKDGIK